MVHDFIRELTVFSLLDVGILSGLCCSFGFW